MNRWKVYALRLNHRIERDKRVTTHLLLTARAFGADGAFYSGQRDDDIKTAVEKVIRSWGGSFEVEYVLDWRKMIGEWKADRGEVVHLTMYGLPVQDVVHKIGESSSDKLVVVGGAKVPGMVYELADWNVSVTSQPHSEIGALSIFLHMLYEGQELSRTFEKARMRIVPQPRGKKIIENGL